MNSTVVMVDDAVTKDSRGTIHIIEVGYCGTQTGWVRMKDEKEQAYTAVLARVEG